MIIFVIRFYWVRKKTKAVRNTTLPLETQTGHRSRTASSNSVQNTFCHFVHPPLKTFNQYFNMSKLTEQNILNRCAGRKECLGRICWVGNRGLSHRAPFSKLQAKLFEPRFGRLARRTHVGLTSFFACLKKNSSWIEWCISFGSVIKLSVVWYWKLQPQFLVTLFSSSQNIRNYRASSALSKHPL